MYVRNEASQTVGAVVEERESDFLVREFGHTDTVLWPKAWTSVLNDQEGDYELHMFEMCDSEPPREPYEFPVTQDVQVACFYAKLAQLRRNREAASDDPMMRASGCWDEFSDDYDRKERVLLAGLAQRAKQVGDAAALEIAHAALEAWMP